MSFPNIPNITPTISLTVGQTVPLLLSSIALEELALAHIINAEAEKLQFVLGTLEGGRTLSPPEVTISNLLAIDSSVQRTLRDVIKKEMLLEFKFENVLDLIATIPGSLAITKTVSDTITTPGTILTFFITVANTGTTPLTNLTVTDTLPAGTTFISANAPGGFTTTTPPVGGTGTVTFFSSNPIPPLGTVSFQIAVMVVNIGIINNTATASADGVAPVTTPPTTTIVGD